MVVILYESDQRSAFSYQLSEKHSQETSFYLKLNADRCTLTALNVIGHYPNGLKITGERDMRRLYAPDLDAGTVTITGPEAHHGRNVLRLEAGAAAELFDGRGRFAPATVVQVGKDRIALRVEEVRTAEIIRPRVVLAAAVPKFAHQETLVRMATEIGVAAFHPIIYRRGSVREQFRTDKWRRWTIEACKQCGQNYLPEVSEAVEFPAFLSSMGSYDRVLYGQTPSDQTDERTIPHSAAGSVLIFVGPEGGFDPAEAEALQAIGATAVRIGPNVLRIETAAVALATIAVYQECGNR